LSGNAPALSWNVESTLASISDTEDSQPIYVRAVFSLGSTQWISPKVLMTLDSAAIDDGGAPVDAGPCVVSLWTGTCEIDDSDATITTANQGYLGVDRTYVSDDLPASGPFGPSWSSNLPTDDADADTLTDTGTTGGLVTVEGADTSVTFVPDGSGGYELSSDDPGEQALTKTGTGAATTFTYSEPAGDDPEDQSDTQQITFAAQSQPAGGPSNAKPWTYQAATVEPTGPAGSAQQTQVSYNASTGYPKQMLAPQPSGVTCDMAWAVGCEALN
jgi:hypothetical protein